MEANKAVQVLLGRYPPDVQRLASQTRKLILEAIPKVEETADASARVIGYGFGPGYRGVVCVIIPSKSGVKLGFAQGAELPDPKKLLQGSGKITRHVQLNDASDLKKAGLKALLKAALVAWRSRARRGVEQPDAADDASRRRGRA